MARNDLAIHFGRIDKLVAEMNQFVPDGSPGSADFRADLAGLLVVAIASCYESCVKDILVGYASLRHPEFEAFVANNFAKLNSKISESDLCGYAKKFGHQAHAKFTQRLEHRKKCFMAKRGINICAYYKQILSWRHDYAHAGVKNTTIQEAVKFHAYARRVIISFDEAFT